METVLSSLGFGTRYCVVSNDHERPQDYGDEHSRCPQTALERFMDFDTVYDKFSGGKAARGEAQPGRPRREKENTSPGASVLALFDKLAQRHNRSEITTFDRQFPLTGRSESNGMRFSDTRGVHPPPPAPSNKWRPFDSSEPLPDWELPPRAASPSPSHGSSSSSGSSSGLSSAPVAAERCAQGVLIDLSDN